MPAPTDAEVASARRALRALAALVLLAVASPSVARIETPLRFALAAACEAERPIDGVLRALGGAIVLGEEKLPAPSALDATRRELLLRDGQRLRFDEHRRDGRLLRVVMELRSSPATGARPLLWLVSDGSCAVRAARRIDYAREGPARAVVTLDRDLADTTPVFELDAPLPHGERAAGVPVAVVDSGVNYVLPRIAERLARRADGRLLGYDYWDMDARPYDAHPARSPFFPQRHGTRTASVIVDDAPVALIAPYRYPRPDMSRMMDLLEDADGAGVRIVNMSLGGARRERWQVFEREAARRPHMLFVVSAGNNGRDIDARAVYPAALTLDNLLVVTSADDRGRLAPGANWGAQAVDLMVPAETLIGLGFDGYARPLAGSSYAAARVSALAACLLAANPQWQAAELKAAIVARAEPPMPEDLGKVRIGRLEDPVIDERGACAALPLRASIGERREIALDVPGTSDDASLVPLDVFRIESSGFSDDEVRVALAEASRLIAQCGVRLARARIHTVRVPPALRYFSYANARQLVAALSPGPLSAWFVRDTLERIAFDAQAIGRSNGRRHPTLVGSVWLTSHLPHPGRGLAHELYHVLADSGAHVPEMGNLMSARTSEDNTRLTDWQCQRLRRVASAFGWLEAP